MPNKKPLKVVELFAGVGGFRLGLEGWEGNSPIGGYNDENPMDKNFEVIWSNQYEPMTPTKQHASEIYKLRWPNSVHSDEDIELVIKNKFDTIPDHDVLVGGFPCQDYSVATTLKSSKGLVGKKGILWWSIYNILEKRTLKKRPNYLILENVDRLLVSPATQRGRDFAIILSCLNELGYNAEWRVINAADYGMPQRRRRIFIIGYLKNTSISKDLEKVKDEKDWLSSKGVLASAFEVDQQNLGIISSPKVDKTPEVLSEKFNLNGVTSPFSNSGMLKNGKVFTLRTFPAKSKSKPKTLKNILLNEIDVDEEFYIDDSEVFDLPIRKKQVGRPDIVIKSPIDWWKYYKGPKREPRENKAKNYKYEYAEGGMKFPDDITKSSRTIITGEGGPSPSRFKHLIKVGKKYRRLTPIELERLNMFPDDHTKYLEVTNAKRAFFMGNALVVGVVEKIGESLIKKINNG